MKIVQQCKPEMRCVCFSVDNSPPTRTPNFPQSVLKQRERDYGKQFGRNSGNPADDIFCCVYFLECKNYDLKERANPANYQLMLSFQEPNFFFERLGQPDAGREPIVPTDLPGAL